MSKPNESDGEEESKVEPVSEKKGITSEVTFFYLQGLGRGDPLQQMFEYHGQPY